MKSPTLHQYTTSPNCVKLPRSGRLHTVSTSVVLQKAFQLCDQQADLYLDSIEWLFIYTSLDNVNYTSHGLELLYQHNHIKILILHMKKEQILSYILCSSCLACLNLGKRVSFGGQELLDHQVIHFKYILNTLPCVFTFHTVSVWLEVCVLCHEWCVFPEYGHRFSERNMPPKLWMPDIDDKYCHLSSTFDR